MAVASVSYAIMTKRPQDALPSADFWHLALLVSYMPLGINRAAKKALKLHALGPQNCQGSLARRAISHELRPQFVALRRPRNRLASRHPASASVSAAVAPHTTAGSAPWRRKSKSASTR